MDYNNPYILLIRPERTMKTRLTAQQKSLERTLKNRIIRDKILEQKSTFEVPRGAFPTIWFVKMLDECGINGSERRAERRLCSDTLSLLTTKGIIRRKQYKTKDLNTFLKYVGSAYDCENPLTALTNLKKALEKIIFPTFVPINFEEAEYWKHQIVSNDVLRTLGKVYFHSGFKYTRNQIKGVPPELKSITPSIREALPNKQRNPNVYPSQNYDDSDEGAEDSGEWDNIIKGFENSR